MRLAIIALLLSGCAQRYRCESNRFIHSADYMPPASEWTGPKDYEIPNCKCTQVTPNCGDCYCLWRTP
jgi:hypothetical protein